MNLFIELSLIIVLATVISILMKVLKQPLIVGYIATGILAGPYVLNILQSNGELEFFSKIGIAILLFIVGLMLNPDIMREVGKTSLITGVGQVIFTFIIGYFILTILGFNTVTSLYVSIALTLSSTIIILKLLSDKEDMHKLYGKISIGFLLIQDIIAIIIILIITVMSKAIMVNQTSGITNALASEIALLSINFVAIIIVLYLITKYVVQPLSKFVAGSQEILFIFSLAWGLGISSLFYQLGFSIEIGALAAGITLATSPFAYGMASKLKPLRDFFIMLFFILLGSQLIIGQLSTILIPAIILSIFVLIGNPLIVYTLLNLLGYRTRVACMAGLTVGQISEFSLILIALGYSFGHVNQEAVSLVTLIGIMTITLSTYMIVYAEHLYRWIKPILPFIRIRKSHNEKEDSGAETNTEENKSPDIIIFGYDRVGYDFVKVAQEIGATYLVVDFNPRSIARCVEKNIPHRYGDAEDMEFLQELSSENTKLIISTIPDLKTNLMLVNYYQVHHPTCILITISHDAYDTKKLYSAGASYVVMPHHLGARHAASLIHTYRFNALDFEKEKTKHLNDLTNTYNN